MKNEHGEFCFAVKSRSKAWVTLSCSSGAGADERGSIEVPCGFIRTDVRNFGSQLFRRFILGDNFDSSGIHESDITADIKVSIETPIYKLMYRPQRFPSITMVWSTTPVTFQYQFS